MIKHNIMNLLPFEGYMIPGINFKDCSIWILNWDNTPTECKQMIEVWILWYDGRKECYINPKEAESVLIKYHSFDKIIPANIDISSNKRGLNIEINIKNQNECTLHLEYKNNLKYSLINFLLKISNQNKTGDKGKTETGMFYHNVPKKIIPLRVNKAILKGLELKTIKNPNVKFSIGDGKPADEPIINYCTHMLEE